MTGKDIKDTIRKIKADNQLIERVKKLEPRKSLKKVKGAEILGTVAAACWILVAAVILLNYVAYDYNNDPVLINTPTEEPVTTVHATATYMSPSFTPEPTSSPTPVPYKILNSRTSSIKLQLSEKLASSKQFDFVVAEDNVYLSVHDESSKLYSLYNVDIKSGSLTRISSGVEDLKIGKKYVVYKSGNRYYCNSYSWDDEKILPIDTDNLIDVYMVSEDFVVYAEALSGSKSFICYYLINMKTCEKSLVYEIPVHGSLNVGIPYIPEPFYMSGNYLVFLNVNKTSIKVYNMDSKKQQNVDVRIDSFSGIGIYGSTLYFAGQPSNGISKMNLSILGKAYSVPLLELESFKGEPAFYSDKMFVFDLNGLSGLFMVDLASMDFYLVEGVSVDNNFMYVSDKLIVLVDEVDASIGTLHIRIVEIE